MAKPVKITKHTIQVFEIKNEKPATTKEFIHFQADTLTILQIFSIMQKNNILPKNHRKVGLALADSQKAIAIAFDTQTPTAEVINTDELIEQLKGLV